MFCGLIGHYSHLTLELTNTAVWVPTIIAKLMYSNIHYECLLVVAVYIQIVVCNVCPLCG